MKNIVITIDGPCCSGKSTIAKKLAKDLGFKYIDTGILYRAVTYLCLKDGKTYLDESFDEYINPEFPSLSGSTLQICLNKRF